MTTKFVIYWSILAGIAFNSVSTARFEERAVRPPSIVFIVADDLGVNDLGCYGRDDHKTPHIDALAREGARFTYAYSAQSVCSPTRAAIMTGLSPARLHITTFLPGRADSVSQMLLHPTISQQLPQGVKTLPSYLKQVGYVSACIGKWHLGGKGSLPTDRGFDLYYAGQANTKPTTTEGGKGEHDLTNHAIQFMEENKDKPYFLYLAHNNPHIPLAARDEVIKRNNKSFNPLYAATLESLDESVGRVLRKLKEIDPEGSTMVVFTSDNGGLHVLEGGQTPTHNNPFRAGKGFLYEGGIRIPLLVKWTSRIKAGSVVSTPMISTDWMPTLLTAAGIKTDQKLDGLNMLEVIMERRQLPERALCWHQPHYMNQGSRPMGAIRLGRWKMIEHYENGMCELFDLEKDIGETMDVSEQHAAKVAELRGKLEQWRRDAGAQRNEPNPDYRAKLWNSLYRQTDVSCMQAGTSAVLVSEQLKDWRLGMNKVVGNPRPEGGAGMILLPARLAVVHGEKLRYEPEAHKDTLGYWANVNDWVEWKFIVPHSGLFEVELLQAAGSRSGGASIEVNVAEQTLKTTVQETGHFQRFVPRTIGTVKLEAGQGTLTIRARSKPGFGVMDLRQVVLREAMAN